jgi:hypothetical protein
MKMMPIMRPPSLRTQLHVLKLAPLLNDFGERAASCVLDYDRKDHSQ